VRISHYDLLDSIGRDGASEIHRARDLRLERDVAVKLLRRDALADPAAVERFKREARVASLVTHPHICAVHDSGEEAGQPFLVLELLEGRALDELMAGRALAPDRLLDIAAQTADALAAAHRRHIVHGNLKPSNVFITNDGHVKLLELGSGASWAAVDRPASEGVDSSSPTVSSDAPPSAPAAGELVHPYLAPEQITGTRADGRADLFALGALMFEMATGTPAFRGETPPQVAAAIVSHEAPHVRSVDRRVPRLVDAIVRKALQKDPARRHQSASEMLDELRHAGRVLAGPHRPAAWGRGTRMAAALAVLVLVAAAVAALAAWRGWWRTGTAAAAARNTVLVSHIANGTADPDFDGTLREAVSVYLAQSPYLELVSDDRIRATLQLMGRDPATRMTHDVAAEVCHRLGTQALLEGSVSAVGRAGRAAPSRGSRSRWTARRTCCVRSAR
jgi:tRNA A-37 threonylcarbamoyl transferase component Bud32